MLNFLLNHSPLLYFVQSLWRDEAFSILVAEKPLSAIIGKVGLEPPLYYFLLHFWIKLFGESEIAARSLSLLGLSLATIVIIVWAEKLFKKHWLSWFLPLLFFFNPMLLYYGFEIRAYSWYLFFALLSMYGYLEKKWLWFILGGVLGFYTHSYLIFVLVPIGLHWLVTGELTKLRHFKTFTNNPFVQSALVITVLIAPWFKVVASEMTKLRQSWYFPVDFLTIKSALGNMFLGYEGTPWYLWSYTSLLSLVLLGFFVYAMKQISTRKRNLFFLLVALVPLAAVIGVSFFKPLFVNRYLLPVTAAEVFLLALALEAIRNKTIQGLLALTFIAFELGFNFWYPSQHPKVDTRTTMREVNTLKSSADLIYAESPLVFFETLYYSGNRQQVFLYNPRGGIFPWYVGDTVFSPAQMADELPNYPQRAFIVRENGSFDVAYRAPLSRNASLKTKNKKSL